MLSIAWPFEVIDPTNCTAPVINDATPLLTLPVMPASHDNRPWIITVPLKFDCGELTVKDVDALLTMTGAVNVIWVGDVTAIPVELNAMYWLGVPFNIPPK